MNIGIGSYTFTWAVGVPGYPVVRNLLTPIDLMRQAHRLEIQVVQICDNMLASFKSI